MTKKRGRPSTFTMEAADEIVERLSEGVTLREICRGEGMPAWRTVYDWMEANETFAARIARARARGFDAIAEDTLQIIDTVPEMAESWSEAGGSKHRDSAHVSWLKNRAEQRLKLLAKWDPKRYGDKLDVNANHSGGVQVKVVSEFGE